MFIPQLFFGSYEQFPITGPRWDDDCYFFGWLKKKKATHLKSLEIITKAMREGLNRTQERRLVLHYRLKRINYNGKRIELIKKLHARMRSTIGDQLCRLSDEDIGKDAKDFLQESIRLENLNSFQRFAIAYLANKIRTRSNNFFLGDSVKTILWYLAQDRIIDSEKQLEFGFVCGLRAGQVPEGKILADTYAGPKLIDKEAHYDWTS